MVIAILVPETKIFRNLKYPALTKLNNLKIMFRRILIDIKDVYMIIFSKKAKVLKKPL